MYKNILVPVDVFEIGLADKAISHARIPCAKLCWKDSSPARYPRFSPILTRGFISDARKMEDYLVNTSKEKLDELSKNSRWRKTISRFIYAAATFAMK